MPKNRKIIKTPKGITRINEPRKLLIGTRKSGKSAQIMSNDELKAVLNNKNQAKYHNKAATVLQNRGVEIVWPGKLVADTSTNNDMSAQTAGGGQAA